MRFSEIEMNKLMIPDAMLEPVDYYKVSKLMLIALGNTGSKNSPKCKLIFSQSVN